MSALEDRLAEQIRDAMLPEPIREYRAIASRRFRWDFAWPEHRLLLEVQGGVWKLGGHTSGAGVTRDCEKATLAALGGFRCLAVTRKHIESGLALEWLRQALSLPVAA